MLAGRIGSSLALVAALALLVACGAGGSGGASSGGGAATLACSLQTEGIDIDVIRTLLTCTVADAPARDTAFTVHYSVTDGHGQTRQIPGLCHGALRAGAGTCVVRFSVVVPQALGKPSVAGETEPDQRPLGPVTPRQQSGTPGSGPFPTYVPQG
ncbi:MAG TPA: hypothetical protein VHI51_15010 [Ktedonobacterales bacterium]|jgi:hypothetical protein|nr:hypothetical protein [Ktedonobacterales bacterium]